jgi:hypothetical protein
MDLLLLIARAQRPVIWFIHAQTLLFWLVISTIGQLVPGNESPGIACRLLLAVYPLFPAVVVATVCWPNSAVVLGPLLALLIYGFYLLVLLNPGEVGWLCHLLLLQTYFSSLAWWANGALGSQTGAVTKFVFGLPPADAVFAQSRVKHSESKPSPS